MNPDLIDSKKLATQLEAAIVAQFRKDFTRVSGTDEDLSLQALYISDAGDALDVAHLIRNRNFSTASKQLSRMDTSPREDLYSLIEKIAGSQFVDKML